MGAITHIFPQFDYIKYCVGFYKIAVPLSTYNSTCRNNHFIEVNQERKPRERKKKVFGCCTYNLKLRLVGLRGMLLLMKII